jgi:hypothetical protein
MNLSERTELLDRFHQNGRKLLGLLGDGVEPTKQNQASIQTCLQNMDLLDTSISEFDSRYFGHKKTRVLHIFNDGTSSSEFVE